MKIVSSKRWNWWEPVDDNYPEIAHDFTVGHRPNGDKHLEQFAFRQILRQVVDDQVGTRRIILGTARVGARRRTVVRSSSRCHVDGIVDRSKPGLCWRVNGQQQQKRQTKKNKIKAPATSPGFERFLSAVRHWCTCTRNKSQTQGL